MVHLNSIATQVLEFLHQLLTLAGTCALIVISVAALIFMLVAMIGFSLFMFARALKELDAYLKFFKKEISDIECPRMKRMFAWLVVPKRNENGCAKTTYASKAN